MKKKRTLCQKLEHKFLHRYYSKRAENPLFSMNTFYEEEISALKKLLDGDILCTIDNLNQELDAQAHKFETLNKDFEQQSHTLQTQKTQLADVQLRQNLVSSLLSAQNENEGVAAFYHTLYNDFSTFANSENSVEDEAQVMLDLQEIGKELKMISAYPEFYQKCIVAVAGGFSAGKSEFISSLFSEGNFRLPIGIEPTTAIPTYVLNNDEGKTSVLGCSNSGGLIDLLQLDPQLQSKLSHNFIRSFGFNLKSIMPFLFLTTPFAYKYLCVIDTPGYNPSDAEGSFQNEDIKTAEEFIHNAEALVWLIGLDSNGTIAKSDLDFLDKVSQEIEKPLYVVLNKADLRPQSQLEEIMEKLVDTLDDYGIDVVGISAYSSILKQEFCYHNQSLMEFLENLDKPSNKMQKNIMQKLYAIDQKYQEGILRNVKENKQIITALKGIELDLLQAGNDDGYSLASERFSKLQSLFSSKHHQEQLKTLEKITTKFADSINSVFGKISKTKRKVLTIDDIELDEKFEHLN